MNLDRMDPLEIQETRDPKVNQELMELQEKANLAPKDLKDPLAPQELLDWLVKVPLEDPLDPVDPLAQLETLDSLELMELLELQVNWAAVDPTLNTARVLIGAAEVATFKAEAEVAEMLQEMPQETLLLAKRGRGFNPFSIECNSALIYQLFLVLFAW